MVDFVNKKTSTELCSSRGYQSSDIYGEPHRHFNINFHHYTAHLKMYHSLTQVINPFTINSSDEARFINRHCADGLCQKTFFDRGVFVNNHNS